MFCNGDLEDWKVFSKYSFAKLFQKWLFKHFSNFLSYILHLFGALFLFEKFSFEIAFYLFLLFEKQYWTIVELKGWKWFLKDFILHLHHPKFLFYWLNFCIILLKFCLAIVYWVWKLLKCNCLSFKFYSLLACLVFFWKVWLCNWFFEFLLKNVVLQKYFCTKVFFSVLETISKKFLIFFYFLSRA